MADPLDTVEHVLQVLQDGARTTTYKFAVLVGLMDLCAEKCDAQGWPPQVVTTRELAARVVELYWGQVGDCPLLGEETSELSHGGTGKGATIPNRVAALRQEMSSRLGLGAGPARVRVAAPREWEDLLDEVEWTLIRYPLPLLQRVSGRDTTWFYSIRWDQGERRPSRREVRRYQAGHGEVFDNRILLSVDAALAFSRLHGVLRPLVEERWALDVARRNGLPEGELRAFLFGANRVDLSPAREPLLALQEALCFYCGRRIPPGSVHVDHFLPWSHVPENDLSNLVAAHSECNASKSDWPAAGDHVMKWIARNRDEAGELRALSSDISWEFRPPRALGLARSLYLRLPEGARLWSTRESFVDARREELQRLLA